MSNETERPTEPPKCPACGTELVAHLPPELPGSWYHNMQGKVIIATRCGKCVRNYETPMSAFPVGEEPLLPE